MDYHVEKAVINKDTFEYLVKFSGQLSEVVENNHSRGTMSVIETTKRELVNSLFDKIYDDTYQKVIREINIKEIAEVVSHRLIRSHLDK